VTIEDSKKNTETAMITGAASGIGLAVCKLLLERGCRVIAVDVNKNALEKLSGEENIEILTADLGVLDEREEVIAAGNGIHYLVNAAGVILLKNIWDVGVEEWRHVQTVNSEATFFLCQGIGRTMQPGGAIVNLSSSSAKLSNTVEAAAYAASKTTILSITRSFAYALAKIPVRVNAVCPAIIDTPMQASVLQTVSEERGLSVEELTELRNSSVPMGRSGKPEELARLIWFLLSDGGGYMTGQSVNFGGGYVTW
jgi:NAD(P)-dependent dehydrogenase (short-subunit alcohol dehydrogenase family)